MGSMGPGGAGRGANHLIFDATLVGAADDAEETLLAPVPGWLVGQAGPTRNFEKYGTDGFGSI